MVVDWSRIEFLSKPKGLEVTIMDLNCVMVLGGVVAVVIGLLLSSGFSVVVVVVVVVVDADE